MEINTEADARLALVIIRNQLALKGNVAAQDGAKNYIAKLKKFDRGNDRVGKWFPTYSGWRYWPEDPRPGDFNIEDIATSLAGTCRFNAHIDSHYSVAQHSILMAEYSERALAYFKSTNFAILMHDGPETFLHDIATPIKSLLGHEYKRLTNLCWSAMVEQYKIEDGLIIQAAVKWLDDQFLRVEARDVFPLRMLADGENWLLGPDIDVVITDCWSKEVAKEKFLERFRYYQDLQQVWRAVSSKSN